MDCFFDAMFRTTGVDREPTSPTRNQLTPARAIDDHCPDGPPATTIFAAPGNAQAIALRRHKASSGGRTAVSHGSQGVRALPVAEAMPSAMEGKGTTKTHAD